MSQAVEPNTTNVVHFQPRPSVEPSPVAMEDVQRLLLAVMMRTMSAKHRKRADVFLSVAERTDDARHRAVVARARSILSVA